MNTVVEHTKSFEEGFADGFAAGREAGLEYGRINALKEALAYIHGKLETAEQEIAS